MTVVKKVP